MDKVSEQAAHPSYAPARADRVGMALTLWVNLTVALCLLLPSVAHAASATGGAFNGLTGFLKVGSPGTELEFAL